MTEFHRQLLRAHIVFAIIAAVIVLLAASQVRAAEYCQASQYGVGDGYHGKRTASGERFNTYALTAAHKTRRFGSTVTVTNLANGRSVVVRISDRGPWIKGRCIDLSRAAANAIGMGGTARVRVEWSNDQWPNLSKAR